MFVLIANDLFSRSSLFISSMIVPGMSHFFVFKFCVKILSCSWKSLWPNLCLFDMILACWSNLFLFAIWIIIGATLCGIRVGIFVFGLLLKNSMNGLSVFFAEFVT